MTKIRLFLAAFILLCMTFSCSNNNEEEIVPKRYYPPVYKAFNDSDINKTVHLGEQFTVISNGYGFHLTNLNIILPDTFFMRDLENDSAHYYLVEVMPTTMYGDSVRKLWREARSLYGVDGFTITPFEHQEVKFHWLNIVHPIPSMFYATIDSTWNADTVTTIKLRTILTEDYYNRTYDEAPPTNTIFTFKLQK